MKHKHFDLIVQWASDPEAWVVEYRSVVTGRFIPIGFESYPEWHPETEYRLIPKRRMMHLNGVEFPAPEKGRYCQLTGLTEGQMRARIAELEAENARLREVRGEQA